MAEVIPVASAVAGRNEASGANVQSAEVVQDPNGVFWQNVSSDEARPLAQVKSLKRSMSDVVAMADSEAAAALLAAKQMKQDQKPVEKARPWTKGHFFEGLVNSVVVANGVAMGVECDYSEAQPELFAMLKHCFASLFLGELLLHLTFEGFKDYFADRANWLDFFLVVMAVFDAWFWSVLVGDSGQSLRLVSLLRLLRLIRLARLVRLFRSFKTLSLLVTGVRHALAALIWAVFFLVIVVYIFSIFARQLIGQRDACDVHDGMPDCDAESSPYFEFLEELGDQQTFFGSIPITMLTLIVCLTEGCGPVVRSTITREPMLLPFWTLFTFTTSVSILQLIVGLFCQTALKDSEDHETDILESREEARRSAVSSMVDVFRQIDRDGDGEVTRDEFLASMASQPEVVKEFAAHGIDCENLFETLNADRTGCVSFRQFFAGTLLIMKGQEKAKAKDVVGTQLISRKSCRHSNDLQLQLSQAATQYASDEAVASEVRSSLDQLSAMSERLNARAFVIGDAVRGLRDELCDIPIARRVPPPSHGPTGGSVLRSAADAAHVPHEREAEAAREIPDELPSEQAVLAERPHQRIAL